MKVQKITNTSIYTQKNDLGTVVSFSGKKAKSMPKISARIADNTKKKPQTVYDEFCSMANGIKRSVRRSYAKSEIHKAVMKPLNQSWKNFSKKAPVLSKGIKTIAVAAVGVGLFEAVKGKISG